PGCEFIAPSDAVKRAVAGHEQRIGWPYTVGAIVEECHRSLLGHLEDCPVLARGAPHQSCAIKSAVGGLDKSALWPRAETAGEIIHGDERTRNRSHIRRQTWAEPDRSGDGGRRWRRDEDHFGSSAGGPISDCIGQRQG